MALLKGRCSEMVHITKSKNIICNTLALTEYTFGGPRFILSSPALRINFIGEDSSHYCCYCALGYISLDFVKKQTDKGFI